LDKEDRRKKRLLKEVGGGFCGEKLVEVSGVRVLTGKIQKRVGAENKASAEKGGNESGRATYSKLSQKPID